MKTSIRQKLMKLFYSILIIMTVLALVFVEISLLIFSSRSKKSIVDQTLSSAESFVEESAGIIGTQLSNIASQLSAAGAYASYAYSGEGASAVPKTPQEAAKSTNDELFWLPCSKSAEQPADEAARLSVLGDYFKAIQSSNVYLKNFRFASETGVFVCYGKNAASFGDAKFFEAKVSEWYSEAKASGSPVFSNVFEDDEIMTPSVTVSVPVYIENKFCGVLAADYSLFGIDTEIKTIILDSAESGYAILLAEDGSIISTASDEASAEELFGRSLLEDILEGKKNIDNSEVDGEKSYIFNKTISAANWQLVFVLDEQSVEAPADELYFLTLIISVLLILAFFVIAVIALKAAKAMCGKITYPIIHLTEQIMQVGSGSFDYTSDIETGDEIEELSRSFESMTSSLKEYILYLSAVNGERERIGAEVNVASQIQQKMFPTAYPAFPSREDFDVYANLQTTLSGGSNFYDYFFINSSKLCIVLGESTGNGISSTLFSILALSNIKSYAKLGYQPHRIVFETNNQLSQNNESSLSVSVFVGIIDLLTGELNYVCTNRPHLAIKQTGGVFELKRESGSFALASMENVNFKQESLNLMQGDTLFLFTSGVSESTDDRGYVYTSEAAVDLINNIAKYSCEIKPMLDELRCGFEAFRNGTDPVSDNCFLLMKYFG